MSYRWWFGPKLLISALLMLALMVAVACGESAAPTTAAAPQVSDPGPTTPALAPTTLAVQSGNTFSFPLSPSWVADGKYQPMVFEQVHATNPGLWDMHFAGHLTATAVPAGPLHNQLVEFNPVNPTEIIGDLAESWTVSEDGKNYTFRLRDAPWWDGQPVTAEDIVFSLDRITLPDAVRTRTAALRGFYEYQTAQVVDPKTVEVPVKFATPLFLLNLGTDYMKMYPKHATENLPQDEANQAGKLLGSGPWMLKEFKPRSPLSTRRPQLLSSRAAPSSTA